MIKRRLAIFFLAALIVAVFILPRPEPFAGEGATGPERVIDLSADYPDAFTFAVLGDSGWGSDEQYGISELMYAAGPDFIIHTGDVVYKTGRWERYEERFIKPYKKFLDKGTIFYPVPGNHDYYSKEGEAFFRYFDYLPGNYYTIKTGLVDFFAIDTNTIYEGDEVQLLWLTEALEASGAPYKVVYMHHPIYSSGDHGYDEFLEGLLRPVFASGGVELVMTGHDHDYERLGPVGGVTYIVTGGGGKDLRPKGLVESPHMKFFKSTHHFLKVEVDGKGLHVEVVELGGEVLETFTVGGAVH